MDELYRLLQKWMNIIWIKPNLWKGDLQCVMRSASELILFGYDNCYFLNSIISFSNPYVLHLHFLSAALDSLIQMKTSTIKTWAIAWTIQMIQRRMWNQGKLILTSWRMRIWRWKKKNVRGCYCVVVGLRRHGWKCDRGDWGVIEVWWDDWVVMEVWLRRLGRWVMRKSYVREKSLGLRWRGWNNRR